MPDLPFGEALLGSVEFLPHDLVDEPQVLRGGASLLVGSDG